jgi:hypothetical protein
MKRGSGSGYITPKGKGKKPKRTFSSPPEDLIVRRAKTPKITPKAVIEKEYNPFFDPHELIIAMFYLKWLSNKFIYLEGVITETQGIRRQSYQEQINDINTQLDQINQRYYIIVRCLVGDILYYTLPILSGRRMAHQANTQIVSELQHWAGTVGNQLDRFQTRGTTRRGTTYGQRLRGIRQDYLWREVMPQEFSTPFLMTQQNSGQAQLLNDLALDFVRFVLQLNRMNARSENQVNHLLSKVPRPRQNEEYRQNIMQIINQLSRYPYNKYRQSLLVQSTINKLNQCMGSTISASHRHPGLLIPDVDHIRLAEFIIGNIESQNEQFEVGVASGNLTQEQQDDDVRSEDTIVVAEETRRSFRVIPDSDEEAVEASDEEAPMVAGPSSHYIADSDDDSVGASQFGYYWYD